MAMLQEHHSGNLHRIHHFRGDDIKTTLLIVACSILVSSKSYSPVDFKILPVQCFNNVYLDGLLDALRYVESTNGKNTLNINYKNGKEVSRDEGDYQLNNKNIILYSNLYNEGRLINPYNTEMARRVARQIILDNYRYTGNWCSALIAYNCGVTGWMKNPSIKSLRFAEKILRRIK
jgi:hypothetical protein